MTAAAESRQYPLVSATADNCLPELDTPGLCPGVFLWHIPATMQINTDLLQNAPSVLARVRGEAARRSLKEFVKQSWSVLEPGRPFTDGWVIDAMCLHLEAVARGELPQGLLITVPPGSMKALHGDTPVFTIDGWKRHGDLQPGDMVYGPDGLFKRVMAVTPEVMDHAYEVEFDDGETIIAGQAHEWVVERDYPYAGKKGHRVRKPATVETHELLSAEAVNGTIQRQDRIPVPAPLRGAHREYLIDPYYLGAWLGDGASRDASLTVAETDIEHFRHYGETKLQKEAVGQYQAMYRVRAEDTTVKLRIMGLQHNKHIPDEYLKGTAAQRLALLQGLMDTDGHCTTNGIAYFSNKNRDLVEDTAFLARSLGCKVTVTTKESKLRGVSYGNYYQCSFKPAPGLEPFRLQRKLERLRPHDTNGRSDRTRNVYVKSLRPAGQQLVKCIQVEGGVYLAGRHLIPTHNSRLVRVLFPLWLWLDKPYFKFLGASYALQLAERDNVYARTVLQSEWYQSISDVSISADEGGKVNFSNTHTGGMRALSVGGAATGFRGDCNIADDLHNVSEGESDVRRAEAVMWFRETFQTRVNDLGKSPIIVVMQRVHQEDVASAAIELGFEHLNIPMHFDPAKRYHTALGWTDPRTQPDELMWPERFPPAAVAKLQDALGPYAAAAQLEQTPVPRKGAMFDTEKIELIDDLPDEPLIFCRAWDLAASKGVGAFTVGLRMAYATKSRRFIITDVKRGQWSSGTVRAHIEDTAIEDGVETHIVFPQDPGQAGKAQAADISADLAGFVAKAEAQTGSKETRADPLASQMDRGNVACLKRAWTKTLIEELRFFPRSKYKDQVDAAASAFNDLAARARLKKRNLQLVVDGERVSNWAAGPGGRAANG